MSGDTVRIQRANIDSRVCNEADCATVLSRYNEFDFCALHQPMVVPRMRGKVL
jgi:hypothetical protein